MAGLMAYALAGAAAGAGEGIVARAKAMAEAALAQQEQERDDAKLEREYELRKELKGMAPGKAAPTGGGSSKPKSSSGSSSAAPKAERLMGEYEKDGMMYGRTSTGVLKPYKDEDGNTIPWSKGGRSKKADAKADEKPAAAAISNTPPAVTAEAPSAPAVPGGPPVGKVVSGFRFKGGNPNDQANWEKVS